MTAKFLNDTGINPVLEEDTEKESRKEKAQNKKTFLTEWKYLRFPAVYFDLWCWHFPITHSTDAKLIILSLQSEQRL